MKTHEQQKLNRARGNVLLLSCLSLSIVALALLISYSFGGLYFIHLRLQSSADEIALLGAKKLNDQDRLGRLNNMIARCRQLVYSSRQDYDKTKQDYPDLESFAKPLLDESRDSANNLESERKRVAALAVAEAQAAMQLRFNELKSAYPLTLPWLQVGVPGMAQPHFGKMDGTESNVSEFTQFQDLQNADRGQNFVAQSPGLKLYCAEIDEILTNNDNDLHFNLCSLPAPVEGMIASARLIPPGAYKSVKQDYAPSVVQVMLRTKIATGLGAWADQFLYAQSTACTTGAAEQR